MFTTHTSDNPTTRLTPNKKHTLCCRVTPGHLEVYLSESAQHKIHQLYITDVAKG